LVLAGGSIRYTVAGNYSGADAFTYTVRDNSGALSNAATVSLDFNAPPVAADDTVEVFKNTATVIDVLANDTDVDGALVPGTVAIATTPAHGTLKVNADGTVTYTPTSGYLGADAFTYTVRDNDGATSNAATVDISVIANQFPWQNPLNYRDVNADGYVSPIDALLIINDLNFRGPRKLPNPPMPPLEPPPYLDASGDGFVSPLDALLIINYLNGAGGEGEGEGEDVSQQLLSSAGAEDGLLGTAIASPSGLTSLGSMAASQTGSVAAIATGVVGADYGLTIGQDDTARQLALREYLTTVDDEDVLEMLAADVADSWDEDIWEHVALLELLLGKKLRGN
jgi:hypothetical protein